MQTTGMDGTQRRTLLESLAAENALREAMSPTELDWSGYGSDAVRRQRTAFEGFKVALPFAVLLWMLLAGTLWVVMR